MDRQILNFTANEQTLIVENPIRISTNKVNYIEAHFALGDNWSGYDSVRAVWFNDYQTISTVLDSQGVCRVPFEVMKRKGQVKVDLVGSISEGDVLTDRLTSYPVVAVVVDCVAPITGAETSPITPSQFEQYVAIVRDLVDSVKDIDYIELNDDYTLTIYYSDGTSYTTTSIRGEQGADGNGIASVELNPDYTLTITYTDGTSYTTTSIRGEKGEKGDKGEQGEVSQAQLDAVVSDLKSEINKLENALGFERIFANWEQGTINYATGEENDDPTSGCRTVGEFVPSVNGTIMIENPNEQTIGLRAYDSNGDYIGSTNITTATSVSVIANKKYRVSLTTTNNPKNVTAVFFFPEENSIPKVQEAMTSFKSANCFEQIGGCSKYFTNVRIYGTLKRIEFSNIRKKYGSPQVTKTALYLCDDTGTPLSPTVSAEIDFSNSVSGSIHQVRELGDDVIEIYFDYDLSSLSDGTRITSDGLKMLVKQTCQEQQRDTNWINNVVFDNTSDSLQKIGAIPIRSGTSDSKSAFRIYHEIGEQFGISMRVRFPDDMQCPATNQRVDFLTVEAGNAVLQMGVEKAKTTIATHQIGTQPKPIYNANIGTAYRNDEEFETFLKSDNLGFDLLKGEDTMALRFKGDCSVSANQDICVSVDETSVRIFHSTNDTTIAEYLGEDYDDLAALYRAIKADTATGEVLENFSITQLSLGGKTLSDVIPATVYLVNQYYRNNAKTETAWDSFPFYFTAKEQGRVYSIDFLLDKNCIVPSQLVVDGCGIPCGLKNHTLWATAYAPFYNSPIKITVGNPDVADNGGIEILDFKLMDIPKSSFPNIRICYAESVYEGTLPHAGSYNPASQMKVQEMADLFIRDNNFATAGLNDIISTLNGNSTNADNIYHFSHDDTCLPVMTNQVLRSAYMGANLVPSFGLMMDYSSEWTASDLKKMNACSQIGWHLGIHTMTSPYGAKDVAYYSYDDLVAGVDATINAFVDLFGKYPIMWDFHHTTETYNVIQYLKHKGFQIIFGGNGLGSVDKLTRYRCARLQISDEGTNFSDLEYLLNTQLASTYQIS